MAGGKGCEVDLMKAGGEAVELVDGGGFGGEGVVDGFLDLREGWRRGAEWGWRGVCRGKGVD